EDNFFLLGFRVEERHCNPAKICHGGMLMTFADMQLPFGIRLQALSDPGFLPTVSLSAEFMAPAPLGSWVQGRTDVLKTTRNLAFAMPRDGRRRARPARQRHLQSRLRQRRCGAACKGARQGRL